MTTEKQALELNGWQARMFRVMLLAVPAVVGLLTLAVVPLSIWLVQNAYMAQETARLVAATAVQVKTMQEDIRGLPPKDWQDRVRELEIDAKENHRQHTMILIALEQIKGNLGVGE